MCSSHANVLPLYTGNKTDELYMCFCRGSDVTFFAHLYVASLRPALSPLSGPPGG